MLIFSFCQSVLKITNNTTILKYKIWFYTIYISNCVLIFEHMSMDSSIFNNVISIYIINQSCLADFAYNN